MMRTGRIEIFPLQKSNRSNRPSSNFQERKMGKRSNLSFSQVIYQILIHLFFLIFWPTVAFYSSACRQISSNF